MGNPPKITPLPPLRLTHGQMLWAVSSGLPASAEALDRLRYLRRLGVPFTTAELGGGRGNRVTYRFTHMIEIAVALFAIRRGLKPSQAAAFLTQHRKALHLLYRRAFQEQPSGALTAEWVRSRGRQIPVLTDEIFLRLHDRYSDTPGKFELFHLRDLSQVEMLGMLVEHYPGEKARTLLPLTRLTLEAVAWALEAPDIGPGRR